MSVADLIGATLVDLGVDTVFGVVGSGNFVVTNALLAGGARFVAARHEGGAATMADGYARMSGSVGVVTMHQGCGFTNALTGIGEAAKSRTPMLVLAADTPGASVLSNFRIDQDGLATGVGAVSERVHSAQTAVADTVRAYRIALHERRTVVLQLPIDIQAEPAVAAVDTATLGSRPDPVRPAADAVNRLADLIIASQRPVFVGGRGARGHRDILRAVAARAGALLATSAVANGLFGGDEWSLGISGGFSSDTTASLIGDADLIVSWGCALNMWTMRHGRLIGAQTTVVQVDDDRSALGRHRPVDLGIHGDVASTAADLLQELTSRDVDAPRYRTGDVRDRIAGSSRWQDVPVTAAPQPDRIDPRTLTIALDELLPADRVLSIDSGNFMGYPSTHLSVPDENGFCFTQAFQSIGLGLATAIGAALAQPHRLPVLGTGDGGLMMAAAELETVVRLGIAMVVIVYNDSAYGAEVHHFGSDVNLSTVTFPETDIAALARGAGFEAVTVRSVADLDAVHKWLVGSRTQPLLIDAKIAADGGAWWLHEAFAKH
ncbi:thiamine pyrophosphate-binding protein [Williamsia sp. CHRR-6]|uniref:thiamine pyrophosphate-binding protein n=1 Tax=Williamsia sp. CHRR-6 TaxID=2835871 RepID=UPI001BD92D17|nr:thiamine pyrophosphate-binding protein [Williamsia sp. CHRR-6]MBT0567567.1 thiamine pyrophosphate-binding protein [Williamsia sp. CHRR-6]